MRPADRAAVEQILHATAAFSAIEVSTALELVDDGLAGSPDYRLIVAVAGERVAGYACFGPTPFTDAVFDLYWIAVHPERQRDGLGGVLLGDVEDAVRAARGRMLLVDTASKPSYARARSFYQARGYSEAARVRDYYAPGDDRITYAKRFCS